MGANKIRFYQSLLLVILLVSSFLYNPVYSEASIIKNRTFNTDLDKITIRETPKRIVTLSMAGTDAVLALGVKPVGYTISNSNSIPSYLKNRLKGIESVGTLSAPDLEKIKALKPDLIVVDHVYEFHKSIIPELLEIAPVAGFRASSYSETMNQLLILGDILGKKNQAKAFIKQFNKELDIAKFKMKGNKTPVIGMFVNKSGMNVWQDNSFSGSILLAIKADYVFKERRGKYADFQIVSFEKIEKINPKVILLYVDTGSKDLKELQSNPTWSNLSAVKGNHVVQVNRDVWSRSRGPIAAKLIVKEATAILTR